MKSDHDQKVDYIIDTLLDTQYAWVRGDHTRIWHLTKRYEAVTFYLIDPKSPKHGYFFYDEYANVGPIHYKSESKLHFECGVIFSKRKNTYVRMAYEANHTIIRYIGEYSDMGIRICKRCWIMNKMMPKKYGFNPTIITGRSDSHKEVYILNRS